MGGANVTFCADYRPIYGRRSGKRYLTVFYENFNGGRKAKKKDYISPEIDRRFWYSSRGRQRCLRGARRGVQLRHTRTRAYAHCVARGGIRFLARFPRPTVSPRIAAAAARDRVPGRRTTAALP